MFGSLFSKLKIALITAAAVLLVLAGAYTMGGRAARQAMEEKARQDDRKRLQNTVDVKNETINEVRAKDASAIHRELRDKWMRD
ncbi:TPA: hypothetical protein P5L65_003924 [Salmonella enterica subsp. enterica serovar Concord]|jgi:hypothetical protein|uniref:hypothetical protein n=1 Tax=Enterobacteriaceae TaxID=543 RepID=UPI0007352A3C|nr:MULTISPECIES: hypothetical protein [Enterobacteriaceae]EBS2684482.1 hypothetical protein [Salmonella enterica subsp. enterica serovar Montevideo]EDM4432425.1 hypothetical protein [Salmonella enterica subsp. enterica serovar Infantis]HED0044543.1 hypothetical protein [Salmonella enterica subsp. enterica serovar Kentucky]AXD22169.1 hypothetical protein CHE19_27065 [Salmonella enterica]EAR9329214.1 hypothetical protein [Salmonella enterica]